MSEIVTTSTSAGNDHLYKWREHFLRTLNQGDLEQTRQLATFILTGVLIGDKVVINLVDLFNLGDLDSRTLGEVAREERTIIQDRITELCTHEQDVSFIKITSRGLDFTVHSLLEDDLQACNIRFVSITISTEPMCSLILLGNNSKIEYAMRLIRLDNPVSTLHNLENILMEEKE